MDIKDIYLSYGERRILRKAEKHGVSRARYLNNKLVNALLVYGLLERCIDERFPALKDDRGNENFNAYHTTDAYLRYKLYRRSRLWPEVRGWIAILLSLIALVVSVLSFISAMQLNMHGLK